MKTTNPYTISLIKENIFYFILFFISFFLLIFSFKIIYLGYFNRLETLKKIKKETQELQQKSQLLSKKNLTEKEIDQYLNMTSKLIPEKEDFFSIINSLETLSKNSGFIITTYTINNSSLSQKNLSLKVAGYGDIKSFTRLLKIYSFASGRLITMNTLKYAGQNQVKLTLTFTFYHQKTNQEKETNILTSNIDKKFLRSVKNKIMINLKENNEDESFSYPTKTNPF